MRDLTADLEICNKATHGKWQASYDDDIKDDVRVCQVENGECVCCLALMGNYDYDLGEWHYGDIAEWRANADFIAAAREGWPEAIERAIKAETSLKNLHIELIPALCEKNDQQYATIQQLSAQVVGLTDALVKTLPIIEELAESIGYGYYKPVDPRDFTPDFECCSKTEISNWKNDCAKADAGKEIGDMRAWGMGTYKIKNPGMIELRDKIKTILTQPDPGAEIRERMVKPEITNSTTSRDIECTESYDLLYRAFDITKNENETLREEITELEEHIKHLIWSYEEYEAGTKAEIARLEFKVAELQGELIARNFADDEFENGEYARLQAVAEAAKKLILLCNSLDGIKVTEMDFGSLRQALAALGDHP